MKNENLVNEFNRLFPIGSEVMLRKMALKGFDYKPHKVRGEAFISSSGDAVAFFEGISGYFSISTDFIKYH